MKDIEKDIFNKGSTTYYWSSKFFPKDVREDVFKLYSFVRVVDDYVDSVPQNSKKYYELKELYNKMLKDRNFKIIVNDSDSVDARVVKNIINLSNKYKFDKKWVDSFYDSMEMDLDKRKYKKIEESLNYVYGSAEVIGLMMSKIMGLPEESYEFACMQGRAMQWINFLRDIDEDLSMDRLYIPREDLIRFGFLEFNKKIIFSNKDKFCELMTFEIKRYKNWQSLAYNGYKFIPKRLRIPLKTATDMYNWTAKEIEENPMIVFDKKIKPTKRRVIVGAGRSLVNG